VLTILSKCCQHFFMHFPSPPFEFIQAVEELLQVEAEGLVEHLRGKELSLTVLAWAVI
jgi:hypothetical protein